MRAPGAALGGSLGSVSAQRECMLGTFSHSPCVSCTSSISGAPPHGHLNLEASKLDAGHPAPLHLISGGPRELPRIFLLTAQKRAKIDLPFVSGYGGWMAVFPLPKGVDSRRQNQNRISQSKVRRGNVNGRPRFRQSFYPNTMKNNFRTAKKIRNAIGMALWGTFTNPLYVALPLGAVCWPPGRP